MQGKYNFALRNKDSRSYYLLKEGRLGLSKDSGKSFHKTYLANSISC